MVIGLPQGGVLSCLLWIIFIDDLPDSIGQDVLTELFADDVGLHPVACAVEGHTKLLEGVAKAEA